jgi:S-adenosylmethionine:tRNA ribosyltransferase-isomerase
LSGILTQNDLLVFNNTKVFPARLIGRKRNTGGKVEILLNQPVGDSSWEAIGKNLKADDEIIFDNSNLTAVVKARKDNLASIHFNLKKEAFFEELEKIGQIPLPPYIEAKRKKNHIKYDNDRERYQTVYAKSRGSVAAPTAGLHFTENLIGEIRKIGVKIFEITLHVGLGTFAHVSAENVEDHQIHKESYNVSMDTFNSLLRLKKSGHRIIAVGTTTTRVLESVYQNFPVTTPSDRDVEGWTQIYIYPGYQFKFVDGLITNFHLPESSLLFLVSAFAGKELILSAYREAINHKYRFYSYGDAMFIR